VRGGHGCRRYPTALSNKFVANRALGRFNTEHAGCGNYATENVVAPSNVSNQMVLEPCSTRPGGCAGALNRSAGCLDPSAGSAAMTFSDAAPLLPGCTALGGEWLATGHDRLTLNVTQSGSQLAWVGLGPFANKGDAYNGLVKER